MNIEIAGPLLPGSTNTLIDSRGRIETLTEIKNIKLPAVGMLFYCMETEKIYVVKTLKNGTLNGYTLADLQIESYEEIGGGAEYVAGDGISISEENVISVNFSDVIGDINSILDEINGEEV